MAEPTAPDRSARTVLAVTAQNVPPERRAAVAAHIEGWLKRVLSTGKIADEETGTTYTLVAESVVDAAAPDRDAAVRHALDQLDAALCETNGADLGGTSDDVLAEVDRWANSVQTQIARVRRSREGARQEADHG